MSIQSKCLSEKSTITQSNSDLQSAIVNLSNLKLNEESKNQKTFDETFPISKLILYNL